MSLLAFLFICVQLAASQPALVPSFPSNFTALVSLTAYPGPAKPPSVLKSRGGYLNWDMSSAPLFEMTNFPFADFNATYYVAERFTYLFNTDTKTCQRYTWTPQDGSSFWIALLSFSWINQASYVGLGSSRNFFCGSVDTDSGSCDLWRSNAWPTAAFQGAKIDLVLGLGSHTGRVGMVSGGLGLLAGYAFDFSKISQFDGNIVVPSACLNESSKMANDPMVSSLKYF